MKQFETDGNSVLVYNDETNETLVLTAKDWVEIGRRMPIMAFLEAFDADAIPSLVHVLTGEFRRPLEGMQQAEPDDE